MNKLNESLTRRITVTNKLGLHARPAARVAELAAMAKSTVWMIKNGEQVDASSVIDMLALCCIQGTRITLRIENPEDNRILETIADLFEQGFQEQ